MLGWGLIIAGVLVAANALVSGPAAFGHGEQAVWSLCIAGALLVACGLHILRTQRAARGTGKGRGKDSW